MKIHLSLFAFMIALSACSAAMPAGNPGFFGEPVVLAKGPAAYSGFDLAFLRSVQPESYDDEGHLYPLGPVFHFCVTSDGQSKEVTWTTGTGSSSPSLFSTSSGCFSLSVKEWTPITVLVEGVSKVECETSPRAKRVERCSGSENLKTESIKKEDLRL